MKNFLKWIFIAWAWNEINKETPNYYESMKRMNEGIRKTNGKR